MSILSLSPLVGVPSKPCKNQIVVKNLRIVAQQWTSSEGHLLRLYLGDYNDLNIYSDYRGRDLDLDLV